MNPLASYKHFPFIFSAVFISVSVFALLLSFNVASAAVTAPYLSFDAESEIVGSDLTNPPFCQTQCGESYEVGKIESAGGAPQGANYFQWHIASLQHSVYNIVHNPNTFPFSPSLGSTVYLAYYFNYSRINGVDVWHEADDSADKGIELVGSGIRWIVSPGHWGSLGNNQDHRYTLWMGNPTYHLNSVFEGNPYWTVVPPNQNGYSTSNPPQLEYERWYSAIMAVKIAADNTGSVALYLDGVKILEWNNIITSANSAPNIEHITMGGTLAQPAYDTPEHYRKYDAMILTDNWQDIVNGGYLGSASTPVDAIAPSIPAGLTGTAISSSQIDLSWIASTDNVGVVGYRVFRNGIQITSTGGVNYSDTSLTPSTSYTYTVSAYDAAENNSTRSASASATTQAASVVPPNVVTPPPASTLPATTQTPSTANTSPTPTPAPFPATSGPASTQTSTGVQQQASAPPAIKEGSLIRGPDGIKVYIINAHGYKRHIFNPAIFNMYGHFTWNEIKDVDQQTLDSYKTSDLYRADGDTKVFSLEEVDESKGLARKQWFNLSGERFIQKGHTFNQVFIINQKERDYYQEGAPITD